MDVVIPLALFVCILVAVPLSFMLAMRLALNGQAKKEAEAQAELIRAMQAAAPGLAEIVSVRTLSTRESDGTLIARLTLRITPLEAAPYTAFSTWEVNLPSAGILAPGQEVAVRISPDDPSLVYPNVSWARPSIWKPS